jgi:hypothetical protein
VAVAWRPAAYRRVLLAAVACGAMAFLVGAVQILPAQEYWKSAMRWIGSGEPLTLAQKVPFPVHQADSLDPVSVLGVVVPRIYTALANPYAGFAAFVLAVIGLIASWRWAATRTVAAVLLVFLILSLGAATWFYGAAYILVPGLDKSRHPATAVAVWHLCLVVLASFGMDRIRRTAGLKWAAAGLASFCTFVYGTMVYLSLADPPKVFGRNEQAMAAFTALLLAAALWAFQNEAISRNWVRFSFFGVALIEVSNVAGYSYFHKSQGWNHLQPLYGDDSDLAKFLQNEPNLVRLNFDRADIPYNFGDWWGIDQYQGYTGVPEAVFRRAFEPDVRKLLGETHWISKSPNWNGQQPVFQSRRGLYVYRLEGASPRVWIPDCKDATSRIVDRYPGFWQIEAIHPCAGQAPPLVINEGIAPGWEATIDGVPAEIGMYAGLLKQVPLRPGAKPQLLVLRYRPRPVYWGAGFTALGGLSAVILLLRRPVKR